MTTTGRSSYASALIAGIALAGCADTTSVERGRLLAERHQCGTCHIIPGVNAAAGRLAVTLQSFGARSYIAGHIPNTEENLVRWIAKPQALLPDTLMPDMAVTASDAQDIAAYLRQLK
jgi:cytochrome c